MLSKGKQAPERRSSADEAGLRAALVRYSSRCSIVPGTQITHRFPRHRHLMCGSCLEVLSPRRKSFLSNDLGQKENLETRGSSDSAGRAGGKVVWKPGLRWGVGANLVSRSFVQSPALSCQSDAIASRIVESQK